MNFKTSGLCLLAFAIATQGGALSRFDLNSATTVKAALKDCAASQEDIYCKAALRVIAHKAGPFIVLIPNQGLRNTSAQLRKLYGDHPSAQQLEAVAKANIFSGLPTNGTITSLSGQKRQMRCLKGGVCFVDRLGGSPARSDIRPERYKGALLYVSGDTPKDLPFFKL